jgi:hypothetical protein
MDLATKAIAGFNISAADYFGRTQSYEFFPGLHTTQLPQRYYVQYRQPNKIHQSRNAFPYCPST